MQIPFNYLGLAGTGAIPSSPTLTTATTITYMRGVGTSGIVVTFRQASLPASGGSHGGDPFEVTSGLAGALSVELLRSTRYHWRRGDTRQDGYFTTDDAPTFDLPPQLGLDG